jgi:hypothetical protein
VKPENRKDPYKSSALSHIKYGEVSLQIEFATLPPKPQPLYEMKMKRKLEKNKENAVTG